MKGQVWLEASSIIPRGFLKTRKWTESRAANVNIPHGVDTQTVVRSVDILKSRAKENTFKV